MSLSFIKMHGLGNDFVIIDMRMHAISLTPKNIITLCDRHMGIGCDQLVLLSQPKNKKADVFVRFFNPDGSEAGACGNASRCIGALLPGNPILQTNFSLLPTYKLKDNLIAVNMGTPLFKWQDIPLSQEMDSAHMKIKINNDLILGAACSFGNPHFTAFLPIEKAETLGPILETYPIFPERANIGFAEICAPDHIRLRVWERGTGLTPACGSGACAAAVNAARQGRTSKNCTITMENGDLQISWQEDHTVLMTGPAIKVFEGTFPKDFLNG